MHEEFGMPKRLLLCEVRTLCSRGSVSLIGLASWSWWEQHRRDGWNRSKPDVQRQTWKRLPDRWRLLRASGMHRRRVFRLVQGKLRMPKRLLLRQVRALRCGEPVFVHRAQRLVHVAAAGR